MLIKALILLTLLSSIAKAPEKQSATYEALARMPVHVTDLDEEESARKERLLGVAQAIDTASSEPLDRAVLVVLAWRETRLARYVHEGRCSDGPRGKYECDRGLAKGLWQIHDAREWSVPEADEEQASLALRLWKGGRARCRRDNPDELAGAFVSYGSGGSCAPTKWAKARADHVRKVVNSLY